MLVGKKNGVDNGKCFSHNLIINRLKHGQKGNSKVRIVRASQSEE